MEHKVKVSCVIPVYNREDLVGAAIESILNQDYQDYEILLIDDGSSDDSCAKIKSYQDTRIRLLCNDKNRGIAYTRQRLMEEARGEYIAFLDSDDVAMANRLSLQVTYLEEHPDTVLVSGSCYFQSNQGSKAHILGMTSKQLKYALIFDNPIVTSMTMIRKETLLEHGIKIHDDCHVSEDYDIWTQLALHGKIEALEQVVGIQKVDTANSIFNEARSSKLELLQSINSKIRGRYLKGLGIFLEDKDLEIWNLFFVDYVNPRKDYSLVIKELPPVFEKVRRQFDDLIFEESAKRYILRNLRVMSLRYKEKIEAGMALGMRLSLKEKGLLLVDHVARILLRKYK